MAAAAVSVAAFWSRDAQAEAAGARSNDLRYDLRWDIPITSVAVAAAFTTEFILKPRYAPSSCRWCSLNDVDAWVHDRLTWSNPDSADALSDRMTIVLLPLVSYGVEALVAHHDGALGNWPIDALLITQALGLASVLHQSVAWATARERPYVRFAEPVPTTLEDVDANLSFFSGHTTTAAALSAATGTIASMRGYRLAPLLWALGGVLTVTTGYLRLAADTHYFTDVVTGFAVGSTVGFAVPYFFHGPVAPSNVTLAVTPEGAVIAGSW